MKRANDTKSMQPPKKQKMSEKKGGFLGKQLSEFASTLAGFTSSMPDGQEPFFEGDILFVNTDVKTTFLNFVKYEVLEDAADDHSIERGVSSRCTLEIAKAFFEQPSFEPEKVQWSAIDVDDDSNIFKYLKELNSWVEQAYFDFLHKSGPAKVEKFGGYEYDFKNMRQINGDAERILKRDQLSPPSMKKIDQNKISFFPKSFPLMEEDFNKDFDCISKDAMEDDKVKVVVDLRLKVHDFEDYGIEDWDRKYETEAEDPWAMKATFERLLQQPAEEGVIMVEDFLKSDDRFKLNTHIDGLSLREPRLFHPGSQDKVLDILHPSLFCYVHKISHNTDEGIKLWGGTVVKKPKFKYSFGSKQSKEEPSKHAWLPSECEISSEGKIMLTSPLVSIHPDDSVTTQMLERLLQEALPHLADVMHYVRNFQFMDEDWDSWKRENKPFSDLTNSALQVVPKIVDYTLQPGESYDGVWHMEGMAHEHIVATVIYVSSRDEKISGGSLRFKRAFSDKEGNYFREGMNYAQSAGHNRPVADFYEAGLTPLGSLETPENAVLIFPNSHVHKLSKLTNTGTKVAKRRICVFFIINPDVKLLSTKHVRNQNADFARIPIDRQLKKWGLAIDELDEPWNTIVEYSGLWSLEDAQKHQLDLMNERKYYKNTWNVREVGLCEH